MNVETLEGKLSICVVDDASLKSGVDIAEMTGIFWLGIFELLRRNVLGCTKVESSDCRMVLEVIKCVNNTGVGENVSTDGDKIDLKIVIDGVIINELLFGSLLEGNICEEDILEVDNILVPDRMKLDEVFDDDGMIPNDLLIDSILLAAMFKLTNSVVDK